MAKMTKNTPKSPKIDRKMTPKLKKKDLKLRNDEK
jgi:hypothetical protein